MEKGKFQQKIWKMENLRKVKIKKRILYGYISIIGVSVFMVLIGVFSLYHANSNLKNFVMGAYTAQNSLKDSESEINVAARYIREMALLEDASEYDTYIQKIQVSEQTIKEQLNRLASSYTENNELLQQYEEQVNSWITITDQIIENFQNGNLDAAKEQITNSCTPALDSIASVEDQLNTELNQLQIKALIGNRNSLIASSILLLVLLFISVVVSVSLARKITESIAKPLEDLEAMAGKMEQGDLNFTAEITGEDEVSQVALSLKKSSDALLGYVSEIDVAMKEMAEGNFDISISREFIGDFKQIRHSIQDFSHRISHVLEQVNLASGQVADSAGQIAEGAQALTEGATDQASAVEQLHATITTIAKEVEENASGAARSSEMAHKVGENVAKSNEEMEQMLHAMEEISQTSKEINRIIATINEIASQTNLLSLNASIEAARAGDAGKGFAVVASQVSKLASESQEAAKNSAKLIERSLKAVENGVNMANATAHTLDYSFTKTKELVGTIDLISEASKMQAEALAEVSDGVDQISAVIEENTAMAEESAASSEEMASQADLLKALVNEFHLKA